MKNKNLAVLALTGVLLGVSGNASAVQYTLTILDTLGGTFSYAKGINNSGQVVGSSGTVGNAATRATIWNNGVVSDLGTLGGTDSEAYGINNSGQVAGSAASTTALRATIWNNGVASHLDTMEGAQSRAFAINDLGQVVGITRYSADNYMEHATIWSGGVATIFDSSISRSLAYGINDSGQVAGSAYSSATQWSGTTRTQLGGSNSSAYGINEVGQIAGAQTYAGYYSGVSYTPNSERAAIWSDTTMTDLGTLAGGRNSGARAINELAQAVGYSDGNFNNRHATIWNGTVATDLNTVLFSIGSGWVLTEATGINDLGQIIGDATNSTTGATQGFLLTPINPVPIPATALLMLSGIGVMGAAARRRKAK